MKKKEIIGLTNELYELNLSRVNIAAAEISELQAEQEKLKFDHVDLNAKYEELRAEHLDLCRITRDLVADTNKLCAEIEKLKTV